MNQDYPYTVANEKINSKDVTIIGARHKVDFFEKYKSFFEEKISEADAVVLEQSVGVNIEIKKHADIWKDGFFGKIGEITHSQQKRLYKVDPISILSGLADPIIGLGAGFLVIRKSREIIRDKRQDKLSRRDFLKKLTYIGLGSYLVLGTGVGLGLREIIVKGSAFNYGLDDLLLYGRFDYRNIVIAERIDRLCHQINDLERMVSFHGDLHSKHIYTYLKNPGLRAKRLAYLPYDIISKKFIREYIPDDEGWTLARTF